MTSREKALLSESTSQLQGEAVQNDADCDSSVSAFFGKPIPWKGVLRLLLPVIPYIGPSLDSFLEYNLAKGTNDVQEAQKQMVEAQTSSMIALGNAFQEIEQEIKDLEEAVTGEDGVVSTTAKNMQANVQSEIAIITINVCTLALMLVLVVWAL